MSKFQNLDCCVPVEADNPAIVKNEDLCEKCGHCLAVCQEEIGVQGHYDLLKNHDTAVCINCGQCSANCPEGAITLRDCLLYTSPLRLLAYRSVGTASGLPLACTAKNARIGAYRMPRLTVALSPTPVSEQKEYDALWGGPVK